jgi:hypothetical protein
MKHVTRGSVDIREQGNEDRDRLSMYMIYQQRGVEHMHVHVGAGGLKSRRA